MKISKIIILMFLVFSIQNLFANNSIYQGELKFKDETNKEFSLKSLEGKKVLISMAYTSCQGTCPMIVNRLRKIENKLKDKNINVDVVIVTYDPGFDTPEHLKDYYRETMGIKNSNWHFLVGKDDDSRMMSMLLGIKYSKNAQSGVIIHDNKLLFLNENGEIISRIESFEESDDLIVGK